MKINSAKAMRRLVNSVIERGGATGANGADIEHVLSFINISLYVFLFFDKLMSIIRIRNSFRSVWCVTSVSTTSSV